MSLSSGAIQAIADNNYTADEGYETPDQRLFALLVDTAGAYYKSMVEANPEPTLDDPKSFGTANLAGVSNGFALIEGLIENLEMNFPHAEFRKA